MGVIPISIHTALAGCDIESEMQYVESHISIHTALAGCDEDYIDRNPMLRIFQSTQPSQAVTIFIISFMFVSVNFNPHSPRRL